MKPTTLGYLVDVAAIAACAVLAVAGVVGGDHAMSAILLVVVGRLRPPTDDGKGGGGTGAIAGSGLLTIVAGGLSFLQRSQHP